MAPYASARLAVAVTMVLGLVAAAGPAGAAEPGRTPLGRATVSGPLPGTVPGDPRSPDVRDTYPFFSTTDDLAAVGYVEQEFVVSGAADAYDTAGNQVATGVPFRTRVVVRRPVHQVRFSGTALVEWQNVTAGYDLDALWDADAITRAGHAWIGVSAQRVGVDQLRGWSPARYGDLDVTGGGRFTADELSYDIYAQAAAAVTEGPAMGGLRVRTTLAVGASQSAGRMTVYYQSILPKVAPVFDGYAFIVGTAPTRAGAEPVFQVLSETDVRTPQRPADTDGFRRWEVAGAAHSGWRGQQYRAPISVRDLGAAPQYTCGSPPFSRVPLDHVVAAAYEHLVRWVRRGTPPPVAPPLLFNADGTKTRDALGLAAGGIRLSQVSVPTALNTGDNTGETFCRLFGTHQPFDAATLDRLYPHRTGYLAKVVLADLANVRAGYLLPADAWQNLTG
ncbi:alpha/beta hydrolase domain-containing protein [Dactylosporangium sp. NBC_01737]|uniref:alpha/beta hydrolase domain-containing protein n=1 Tax=Dactylosporangium sp. NBC_01737 TaxID=2975959 RepID=UPI002E119CD2|nr:alpha/beta hydrolase domain-containing protein [Dactylosporangium sp. NBC_01737]